MEETVQGEIDKMPVFHLSHLGVNGFIGFAKEIKFQYSEKYSNRYTNKKD